MRLKIDYKFPSLNDYITAERRWLKFLHGQTLIYNN